MGPREPSGLRSPTAPDLHMRRRSIGGDKSVVLNAELLFPIMEQYGVRGVAFFDMGNAFSDSLQFQ